MGLKDDNMKWIYVPEDKYWENRLGCLEESVYLKEQDEKGWELVGPPISKKSIGGLRTLWVYYWRMLIKEQ